MPTSWAFQASTLSKPQQAWSRLLMRYNRIHVEWWWTINYPWLAQNWITVFGKQTNQCTRWTKRIGSCIDREILQLCLQQRAISGDDQQLQRSSHFCYVFFWENNFSEEIIFPSIVLLKNGGIVQTHQTLVNTPPPKYKIVWPTKYWIV